MNADWANLIRGNWDIEYPNYLISNEWQVKRFSVLQRAKNLCEKKGCTEKVTDIHHLTYANVGLEPLEDLQALCHECHAQVHGHRKIRRSVQNHFLKLPVRLFDLSCKKGSNITHSHLVLYGILFKRANWRLEPAETGKLSISKLLGILEWKQAYFFKILGDLIRNKFIERVYDRGKKRSSLLKIQFLPDP